MCAAIGWGVIAARTMAVEHFGHGAVAAISVTVAAAASCIIGLSQAIGCAASLNNQLARGGAVNPAQADLWRSGTDGVSEQAQ